jgi:hypothetical protein
MGGPTNEPRCPPTDRGSFFVDCAGQALGRKAKPQRDRTKLPERRLGELPVGVVRIEREDCAVGEGVKSCPRAGCGRSSGSLLPGSCFITSKTSPGESLESLLVCSSIGSLRKCILNALVFKPFLKCCELIEMIGKLFQSAAAHVAMVRPVEIASHGQ